MTLQKKNLRHLARAVFSFAEAGARTIGCSFFIATSYTSSELVMDEADYRRFFKSLDSLSEIVLPHSVDLFFDLHIRQLESMLAFLRSDWFEFDALQEQSSGLLFLEKALPNGLTLYFQLNPWPYLLGQAGRITAEGYYLTGDDVIDTTKYQNRSLGNIVDFQYDFGKLHGQAFASQRIIQLVNEYHTGIVPRLRQAFEPHQNCLKKIVNG